MARKRAFKKRVDYRKGGRVNARTGGRQFGELDALMPNIQQRFLTGKTSTEKVKPINARPNFKKTNPTAPRPDQTLFQGPLKGEQTPPNYVAEGTPIQARQFRQDQAPTSVNPNARLANLSSQQEAAERLAAQQKEAGVDSQLKPASGDADFVAQTNQPVQNNIVQAQSTGRLNPNVDRTKAGNRRIETGKRTTGGGKLGMSTIVPGTTELTEAQQAAVDRAAEAARKAADKKAADEAADPTASDPAKKLMGRVGTEDFPTYNPTTAEVAKLNTGAVTAESSDADKLKAGISPDALQLSDTDKPVISDPTDITPTDVVADSGTAGSASLPDDIDAASYEAELAAGVDPTKAAQGEVSRLAEAEGPEFKDKNKVQTATRDSQAEQEALAKDADYTISDDALVDKVTGKVASVVQTDPAEKQQRELQLGMPAPDGDAAQIINEFGFGNSMKPRLVQGAKAKQAAAAKLATDHDLDPEVANQIMEDVEGFKIEGQSQEALGAVAALPKEALVSTQIENLVSGMEDGKPPVWARPAVAAVEQMMASRGLSASTVGRDALFNSIIQSAMPIAQANATALQQRAAQNLSNEQQALIQDRQIAASFLEKNADFKQQMNLANLSNDQQMRLANLTSRNQNESENLSASQQTEMANLNARLQTNLTSAKIAADMNQAQLSVDQQRAVTNATMNANVDMTKFNAAQQVQLANSKFMQNATLTDFNARQQSAMQNATTMASMDIAAADQRTKLAITNANNFLQMDMTNLNNQQQAIVLDQQLKQQRLLSDQSAKNMAKQFNATSENQTNQFLTNLEANMNQFNTSQSNAMEQFNTAENNRMKAVNSQNSLEAEKFNTQIKVQVDQYNATIDNQRDMWNTQNAQAVEQSNIEWRRKSNTLDTAAQNAANQLNAQQAFAIDSAEQNFIWQEMRDQSAYLRQAYENDQQRRTTLYATAIANETSVSEKSKKTPDQLVTTIDSIITRGQIG